MAYELDGLRLRVTVTGGTVDDPLPASFGWASAIATRTTNGETVAGTATPDGLEVLCVWAPDALSSGVWNVQVRAGATQGTARTVYDEDVTIEDTART